MVHGIHIGHDAVEHIGIAHRAQTSRDKRCQFLKEKHSQISEQLEGGVVSNDTLAPTPCGASHGKTAYKGAG
ncbi:Uncharacterised protein [Vibrio cholerae]|uniref:Uncharacterized protein n=1 Tax=Vibrio cholerae TaxID=666 RepID=A0A655V3S3_VIBCL|nr:Uncharacterised protein [Vibrio cholerae]CSB11789.1 Uncharacterised protein [Vibrio cholerae]CSB60353.1 Uncharacterised protein [Vibrio cholerae]